MAIEQINHLQSGSVTTEDSTAWLLKGWEDFKSAPGISLLYGGLFVGIGYLMVYGLVQSGLESLLLPMASSFMLVGPLLTVLLYEVSKTLQNEGTVGIGQMFGAVMAKSGQLAVVGFVLAFLTMVWMLLSLVIFSVFFGGTPPDMSSFYNDFISQPQAPIFLVVGTLTGGVLATIAFAVSAISLPMIMDKEVNGVEAIVFSIAVVRKNWRVMFGWAAMLALLTFCGMATFFLGLVITIPLCGYATWHAYKHFAKD
ncbi:MAG: DUF2189 domain-containing protein [Alphaproteobacteria bacterium]|nr:DUF2189 domain-containing protein [Alphaproteobacteria bacterium]